ncbi:hypothetical protein [Chlorobaculum sp. 24CR]|uniref:hypothetical protein n=1 Tax=Chlorobaculum sp. 24CR TaxID=2508878 RepID=UPI0014320829|nr:hypothetical protein [Chlorobaculum sp. 24CR]
MIDRRGENGGLPVENDCESLGEGLLRTMKRPNMFREFTNPGEIITSYREQL